MPGSLLFRSIQLVLLTIAALANDSFQPQSPFACTGGSVYFSAHPADSLLYQNPDLFHDFYVYKCITTILFTSGDRGVSRNFSQSLERGLEAAYSYMAGTPIDEMAWDEAQVELNEYNVTMRFLKDTPNVQVLYLRLPDGSPDGQGYKANGGISLKKLYKDEVKFITATDESATYSLDSLKGLIATMLKQRAPRDIKVLDFLTAIPEPGDYECDHSDHSVSARLVVDVVKKNKIEGNLMGYAGSFMRKLDPTLNDSHADFATKVQAFFQYAKHDEHMCQTYDECIDAEEKDSNDVPDDVRYAATSLEREYHVS